MSTNDLSKILDSSARTANTSSNIQSNPGHSGLHLVLDVSAAPTAGTITPSIVGISSNGAYTILTGSAISSTGTTVLKVYPGIAQAANVAANDVLPMNWKVDVVHSTDTSFTYSVTANLLK